MLNDYVSQRQYTIDAEEFSGPRWRRPILARDSGFYVAQVQVVHPIYMTSLAERDELNVKQFAVNVADSIEALFPFTPRPRQTSGTPDATVTASNTWSEKNHD